MKTKLLILFILIVAGLLMVSLFLSPKEAPVPEKVTKKANLSLLTPGQTERDEVFKKTGEPSSIEIKNGRTYLYYETQNASFKDVVALEKDVQVYAVENIFSDKELSLTSSVKSFGNYETYYSTVDPFLWYVFLDRGVALKTDRESILAVLYFVPQTKNQFLNTIAKEVGISEDESTFGFRP